MNFRDRQDIKDTMRRLKICVIVPTYNNAVTLPGLLNEINRYTDDVIVVNDGSTDSSTRLLKEFIETTTVISYARNRGKGYALKTGFRKAMESGFDYAITMDADGQHLPKDIPAFVAAVAENRDAIIVGRRDLSGVERDGGSNFANRFSDFWFSVQTLRKAPDTQSGFRAYPLKSIKGLNLISNRYEAEEELLVFAAWCRVPIVSIPVDVYYPEPRLRVSHFRPFTDFARISLANTALCFGAIFCGLPLMGWHSLKRHELFNREFKPFTRKKEAKKEAATTLGRLARSAYGLSFFVFGSLFALIPLTFVYFGIGKRTERKKYNFHRLLQRISVYISTHLPGAQTVYENIGNLIPKGSEPNGTKPVVIVCNHQSHLDIPVLMAISPKLVFLTNDRVYNNFFYGRVIREAGFLPVSMGMENLVPRLRELRDNGYSVVVFPEGSRSADCSVKRFHKGAFELARQLEMDILPVVLHGAGHFLPKEDFMFRRGKITVRLMPPYSADYLGETTVREQASFFRNLIRQEYFHLADEVENTEYFLPTMSYRYAWRGWKTTALGKSNLRNIREYADSLNHSGRYRAVRIINSGIGAMATLYALANKESRVVAFESDLGLHKIAVNTPGKPENLEFRHAVWNSEMENESFDLTVVLEPGTSKLKSCSTIHPQTEVLKQISES